MGKYWTAFKTNWQYNFEYRGEFFAHLLRSLATLTVLIFVFKAVFSQTDNFSGYTFSSMFTYLVMVRVLHFVSRGNTARLISQDIKEGNLSSFLLKPFSYLKYQFISFLANRLFEMTLTFSLIIFFLFFFSDWFSIPSLSYFLGFLIFLVISLILNFLINLAIAFSTFWLTDIRLFSTLVGLTFGFLAGELIPLDVLPEPLKKISLMLPFQYTMYFPIKIYKSSLTLGQFFVGLFWALVWTSILFILSKNLWRKGVRKYEAIGQ
jgi:ABC-2 type transport system permease protein